ncbi:MAG TPA: CPBP family intramembrane glutamic endopeptidase [Devosia sp.]|nr:CPBP family intramembrane glutamic endopeptidase [Devosia sp.]
MLSHGDNDFRCNHWLAMLAGLAIAYSPQYMNPLLRNYGADWNFIQGPPSVLVWNWLAVGALAFVMLKLERQPLASIGLQRLKWGDVQWGGIFWGISALSSTLIRAAFPPPPSDGMAIILSLPLPVLIAIIVTTATTEEILFRGYPIERLRVLTGHLWIGTAVSLVLFLIPHLVFFGTQWVLYQGVGLVLLYVLYLWRRSLMACMIMHLLGNSLLLIAALAGCAA